MISCWVLQNSRIVRPGVLPERRLLPLPMKTGTGHSSPFFFWKFPHLNIDKVCHRQALFVFLPLLLLHIASHALALSPVSVAPFFFAFSHFRPTSPTLLKNPWAFVRKQTSFRKKSTSFETKQTSKIRYSTFPLGYPPAPPLSSWGVGAQRLFI